MNDAGHFPRSKLSIVPGNIHKMVVGTFDNRFKEALKSLPKGDCKMDSEDLQIVLNTLL